MLTGEWIDEETTEHRPFAVMLNNIKAANPQSGIGQADIVYEALTEAGITRFLALYGIKEEMRLVALLILGSEAGALHGILNALQRGKGIVRSLDGLVAVKAGYSDAVHSRDMINPQLVHFPLCVGGLPEMHKDRVILVRKTDKIVPRAAHRAQPLCYEEGYEPHFLFYAEDTVPAGALREEAAHGDDAAGVPESTGALLSSFFQVTGCIVPFV